MGKRLHPLFPKKGNLGITKNDRDITLTAIAAKVYNALLLNHIWPGIYKIIMNFREINPQLHRFWIFIKSLKEYVKKSWSNTIVHRFPPGIWFHTQTKDGAKTSNTWSPQRNYDNALQKHQHNGSLIQCWHCLLWRCHWSLTSRWISTQLILNLPRLCSMNRTNKMVSHEKKRRSRWYHVETMTDTNYTDDLALLTNITAKAESQLHSLVQVAGCIGL